MKYKWSTSEIEKLFYRARIVIDDKFGGKPGTRCGGHDHDNKHNVNRKRKHKKQSRNYRKLTESRNNLKHFTGILYCIQFLIFDCIFYTKNIQIFQNGSHQ